MGGQGGRKIYWHTKRVNAKKWKVLTGETEKGIGGCEGGASHTIERVRSRGDAFGKLNGRPAGVRHNL